jgi:hypothetical protein
MSAVYYDILLNCFKQEGTLYFLRSTHLYILVRLNIAQQCKEWIILTDLI